MCTTPAEPIWPNLALLIRLNCQVFSKHPFQIERPICFSEYFWCSRGEVVCVLRMCVLKYIRMHVRMSAQAYVHMCGHISYQEVHVAAA